MKNIFFGVLLISVCLVSPRAEAAGITIHLFMADQAIDDETNPDLKDFLQRNRNSVRNGAMFPDSGYIITDSYGEFAHWEVFLNGFVSHLNKNCSGKLSKKCEKLFAFFLGVLSHDLSDITWHRDFVWAVARNDFNNDYNRAHPYSDTGMDMLAIFDYKRATKGPTIDFPTQDLAEVFALAGFKASKADLDLRTTSLYSIYWGERIGSLFSYYSFRSKAKWAPKNYYGGPGGVVESAKVIRSYWEKVWERHERNNHFSPVAIGKFRLEGWSFPFLNFLLD